MNVVTFLCCGCVVVAGNSHRKCSTEVTNVERVHHFDFNTQLKSRQFLQIFAASRIFRLGGR